MESTSFLDQLGWSPDSDLPDLGPGESIGRVAIVHRGQVDVLDETGLIRLLADALPAAGDFVVHDGQSVLRILPRRSVLRRQSARAEVHEQVLAANVDVVFVTTSMNKDFNTQRLLRTHAALAASPVQVVVVLTKADLDVAGLGRYLRELDHALPGLPVVVTSTVLGMGMEELRGYVGPGRTAVLLGTSGVGKSSLVNALIGEEMLPVQAQRRTDDRGRHTTTRRELIPLTGGGLILDTPGLRGLTLWDGDGLDEVFADLKALARDCRYRDCQHESEPGCAILEAIEEGALDGGRLRAWKKLQREVAWQENRKMTREQRDAHRAFTKKVRAHKKERW